MALPDFVQRAIDLLVSAVRPDAEESPRDDRAEPGPADADVEIEGQPLPIGLPDVGISKVGAWVGSSSMATAATTSKSIAFARSIGLKRLDVIVNDDAELRDPSRFATYDRDKIRRIASESTAAGIDVHLMSWLMPHAPYIAGAADILRPLVEQTGARSVVFDCEEPWTQARRRLPYEQAADLVARGFAGLPFGVTGIGYASVAALRPICRAAAYLVPQCYATATSGISPATVVARIAGRWRALYGRPIVVGLAAYRQIGIPGYTAESAMRAAFGGAESDPEAREVVYWSLGQIRANPAIARVVRSLAAS